MVTAVSTYDPRANLQIGKNTHHPNGGIMAEIEGLITVYNDGRVERSSIVPNVAASSLPQHLGITCGDVAIFDPSRLWARVYVPSGFPAGRLPVLVYFHGGGFCVGSAAWKCYHEFLANLSSQIPCVTVSVNYRLAPEHRLPAAYDDGVRAVAWVKQQASKSYSGAGRDSLSWWTDKCDFSRIFLAGDSAGANIAYNVASSAANGGGGVKGLVLIQPFFGGEARTNSEKHAAQPPFSALTLAASDAYWALALPEGCSRDHPWCNPLAAATRMNNLKLLPPTMVCISEMDILKDRNIGFCAAMGTAVEKVVYKGVGHAFQILHNSPLSHPRTHEMMSHLRSFVVHHH
ncbi:PREDICTED: probable carboxylesterase 17 isoform X2 [Ipomoea nil]|uniref:probable carboxylesterase 17 isoform X2 n=1 Tax=Ipomoea nil TaxID=35883 RepID=UPI000900CB26|nr:PREDICTED: probable carboxylesterase 17 isoform X2 [Ipomoea nil]